MTGTNGEGSAAEVGRCSTCYRRLDSSHRVLGRCPVADVPAKPTRRAASRRGYVPPSRAHRMQRDDYLESVRVTPEHKRAVANERMRRWREKQRAAS